MKSNFLPEKFWVLFGVEKKNHVWRYKELKIQRRYEKSDGTLVVGNWEERDKRT